MKQKKKQKMLMKKKSTRRRCRRRRLSARPGNAIQADTECEAERTRQYLGRLAEAHNIDPACHQAFHNVVHGCVGVSTGEYGCERVHRPAVDHDLDESQQGASLSCAGWTLQTMCRLRHTLPRGTDIEEEG